MTKARTLADNYAADINQVTADAPLTGGGTSGTVTVGIQAGTTAQSGAVQLTDSTASTSITTAATPNAVKSAYDLADAAVPKSLVDAKADLITATADNTPARLAVGNNGDTLVADSSASTGLRYQAGNGLAQGAINGAFDIWQRGTGSFSAGNYCADRWFAGGGNASYTQESTAANLPTGFRYGIKMTMSGTDVPYVMQAIETANAIYYAGKRVVLSYYVASSASSNCNVRLDSSTGTDTGVQGSFTQITAVSGYSATQSTTTTMARKYAVYDVPSDCKSLRIIAGSAVNITSGNTMTITGIQLEVGSVPTEFRRAGGNIAGELAACQRYYFRTTNDSSFARFASGSCESTTAGTVEFILPVQMRVAPTAVEWSNLRTTDLATDYGAPSSVTINTNLNTRNIAILTVNDTGWTQYRPLYLEANNNAAAHLAVTAEL